MDDGMGPESALEWGPFLWGGTWGFHAPIWGTHPTDKTPSSHRFSPTSLTLITLSLLLSLSLQGTHSRFSSPHQSLPRFSNLQLQVTVPHRPLSPKGQHRRALPYPAIRILSTPPFLVWCSVRLACTAPQPAHQSTSDGTAFCAYHRLLHKTGASLCDFAPCSLLCQSPKAKASPPRGPYLAKETSD
ncbi:uncharacterized protein BDZ83DRAFT_647294 [Colletotrichum acutatum]|uniref:Uncharacterized protein n=1 Tax=Glomerella acutata TaxID=27357 RepID=A0AAD9D1Z1_GLOAC|nr:uncharacterized protein BDZ83DRAFT_647294 [Colletotrichum acutatum]KAK1730121.1 hypothetical protein BDZ83DRAFT_647294 [Colletotrichum acutatum]